MKLSLTWSSLCRQSLHTCVRSHRVMLHMAIWLPDKANSYIGLCVILQLSAGAGFVYPIVGDMMMMPGLPTRYENDTQMPEYHPF